MAGIAVGFELLDPAREFFDLKVESAEGFAVGSNLLGSFHSKGASFSLLSLR